MSFRYFAQNVCKPQHSFLFICIFLLSLSCCQAVNKYSKEANQPDGVNVEDKDSWKSIDKPFRLAKINLIWAKAQKVFVKRIKSLVDLSIILSNTEADWV